MTPANLRSDARDGKLVRGAMVFEFFTPGIAQILKLAGCDFVLYDMEHTGAGLETLKAQAAYCRGLDIVPMCRVPRGEYAFLAGALDVGMKGVMVPMVESAEQARAIVEATHYPPVGRRGAAFGFAHDDYETGAPAEKIEAAHAGTTVIAQIETERGLENVEAIAAVDGIDILWVGHFDLTNFLGIPGAFDDARYTDALDRIVAAGKAHGKALAFMPADAETAAQYRARDFNVLGVGTDMGLLMSGVGSALAGLGEASS